MASRERHNCATTASNDDRRTERIRRLNDRFRATFLGSHVVVTSGIHALGEQAQADVLSAVRAYASFDPANDPFNEHDFGSLTCCSRRVLWKIDYYDPTMEFGAVDPFDPANTVRVLTIMLASEY